MDVTARNTHMAPSIALDRALAVLRAIFAKTRRSQEVNNETNGNRSG